MVPGANVGFVSADSSILSAMSACTELTTAIPMQMDVVSKTVVPLPSAIMKGAGNHCCCCQKSMEVIYTECKPRSQRRDRVSSAPVNNVSPSLAHVTTLMCCRCTLGTQL
jgi:hypothetical protein